MAHTTAAGFVTHRPCGQWPYLAINWAGVLSANSRTVQMLTRLTKVIRLGDNASLPVLHASTTGTVARTPLAEVRYNAINSAMLSVAFFRFLQHRTHRIGGGGLPCDGTAANLQTSATCFRAVAKLTPASYRATDRAWTSIAFTVLIIEEST